MCDLLLSLLILFRVSRSPWASGASKRLFSTILKLKMPEVEGDGFACAGEDGVARRGEEPRFLE